MKAKLEHRPWDLDAWIERPALEATPSCACCAQRELDPPEPVVKRNPGVVVSEESLRALKRLLHAAGLSVATVTSGRRTPAEQIRIMFNMLEARGEDYVRRLYGRAGRQVVDSYAASRLARRSGDEIRREMLARLLAVGPHNVSNHIQGAGFEAFDVAPSSLVDPTAFRRALDAALATGVIRKYLGPPADPAFHIELQLRASTALELAREFADAPALAAAAFATSRRSGRAGP